MNDNNINMEGDFVDPNVQQSPWMPYDQYLLHKAQREAAELEALKNPPHLRDKRRAEYPMSPKESYPGIGGTQFTIKLEDNWMGKVADVQFWPRVLTEEEIRANYEEKKKEHGL